MSIKLIERLKIENRSMQDYYFLLLAHQNQPLFITNLSFALKTLTHYFSAFQNTHLHFSIIVMTKADQAKSSGGNTG